jgi:hypothetical protein
MRATQDEIIVPAVYVTWNRIVCLSPRQDVSPNQTDVVVLSKISITLNNATYYSISSKVQFLQYSNVTISKLQPVLGPANTQGLLKITGQNLQSLSFPTKDSVKEEYAERFPTLNLSDVAGDSVYFGMVCRFDGEIVQAVYFPAVQTIECKPQIGKAGNFTVTVSLNGVDFSPPVYFLVYDQPRLNGSFPQGINEDQRSDLLVSGGVFPTSTDDGSNLRCRIRLSENDKVNAGTLFGADRISSSQIKCKGTPPISVLPTTVTSALLDATFNNQDFTAPMELIVISKMSIVGLEPSAGPNEGGTVVTVIGTNFAAPLGASNLLCRFGTSNASTVVARLVSSTSIACVSPRNVEKGANKRVYIQLSSNGQDYFPDARLFLYYVQASVPLSARAQLVTQLRAYAYFNLNRISAQAELVEIQPPGGIVQGGTNVTIRGNYIDNYGIVQCKFASTLSVVIVNGTKVDSIEGSYIMCTSPALPKPPGATENVDMRFHVEVTLNGQQYSNTTGAAARNSFLYYSQVAIERLQPWGGPVKGLYSADAFTVFGRGFFNSTILAAYFRCRFTPKSGNGKIVISSASFVSTQKMLCSKPDNLAVESEVELAMNGQQFTGADGTLLSFEFYSQLNIIVCSANFLSIACTCPSRQL